MTKQRKCGASLVSEIRLAIISADCAMRSFMFIYISLAALGSDSITAKQLKNLIPLKIAKLFRSKSNDASVLDSKSVRLKVFLFFLGNGHSSMSLRN